MKTLRGFSLIEFMVAITLAMVVTTAVISIFVGSRTAFQSTSGTAALSDSGRFALDFLENAVRDAGFMSCGNATKTVSNLNPEATSLFYAPGPGGTFPPLGGFEAAGTGVGNTYADATTAGALANWNPNLDGAFASLAATSAGMPIQGDDVLVVRSAAQNSQPSYVNSIANGAINFTVDAQRSLQAPEIAIISNCGQSMLFQITGFGGNIVTHAPSGAPGGNASGAFPMDFSTGSQVAPLAATVYFIGLGADGDGALYSANVQTNNTLVSPGPNPPVSPSELVPDIEAMQILYGLDATGVQNASQYVTADQVPDFSSVMSVQMAVLAAGPLGSAPTPPAPVTYNLLGTLVTAPQDTRARQVFEVTIAARNALP